MKALLIRNMKNIRPGVKEPAQEWMTIL